MIENLIIIKGAGDLATGVAHRLKRSGFSIVMLEVPNPTVIRRTVSFAEAVYKSEHSVEDETAILAKSFQEVNSILESGRIAILIDPYWHSINALKPMAVVDAIIAKKNLGTHKDEAKIVIGLGPGFIACEDVHAVIETKRGHNLGRVILKGSALPNTGIPGEIEGYSDERVLRSPEEGTFRSSRDIGEIVYKGDIIAFVNEKPIFAPISGVLRGLLHNDIKVSMGFKVADIDPRGIKDYCITISEKARAIGGGVLEALLYFSKGVKVYGS